MPVSNTEGVYKAMLKLIASTGAAVLMLAVLTSCTIGPQEIITGSGNVIEENRNLSGFTGIELGGVGMLVLTQDGTESVVIEGEDNILARIRTDVSGNTLRIRGEDNVGFNPTKDLIYRINVSEIERVVMSGAGSVQAGDVRAESLTLESSGAGNVNIEKLTAEELKVTMSGVGNVMIGGSATRQEVTLSGMGSYQAPNLDTMEASINISGAGAASVRVSDRLNVEISGAGSVNYTGDPQVEEKISGAGSVNKR
jgi:hypothetical protein